jgi:hypothetical protein
MDSHRKIVLVLVSCVVLPVSIAIAQPPPGKGPGPYGPGGAGPYATGNPYAQELNALATKDPAKHQACFKQAEEKGLRQEARWKFMLDCMKK